MIGHNSNPTFRVSDLIDPVKKESDSNKLRNLLHPNDIPLVRSLHLSRNPKPDGYCWNLSISGKYSVKSGYMLARSKPDNEMIFRNQLPPLNLLKEKNLANQNGEKI